jgi:lysophospholipase L1-like esterase
MGMEAVYGERTMLLAFFLEPVKLGPMIHHRRLPAVLLLTAVCGLPMTSRAKDLPDPFAQWEEAIASLETKDKKSPPPKNAVLFVGSSSIRMWDLPKSFPEEKTINRGFGGSQIADSTHFAARLIFPYHPRQIIFYAGDNDLAKGKSAEEVAADFDAFVKTVRKGLPDVPIAYIAVKPSIARWKLWPIIQDANARIRGRCEKDATLTFIDIAPPMLGDDGLPKKELFLDDGLHMNPTGYALWNEAVRKILVPE